jgi:hypothetical protein
LSIKHSVAASTWKPQFWFIVFPKKKNWNLLGFILDKVFTSFPMVVKIQHCKYKPVRSQELCT